MRSIGKDPYYVPPCQWERARVGTDMYQIATYCPYCGHHGRDRITQYRGIWLRLKCRKCGTTYEVHGRDKS